MFVKTVYEIKKRGQEVIGLMIGDVVTDADREYKKNIGQFILDNGMKNDIYAPGFRRDVGDILAATDCVVVPSSEGMPLTVLEAMSAKTHVVGMDQGGSKEVLISAGCGELFPAGGEETEVADAVLRAMKQGVSSLENGYRFCLQQSYGNYSKGIHGVFSDMK